MNTLYPMFLKLAGSPVLVVGGGNVAEQKVKGLLASHASITVVAPKVTTLLSSFAEAGTIRLRHRRYQSEDVDGQILVFGATDDPAVQEEVFRDAGQRNIPVNIADVPDRCTFYLSSVFEKGDLKVAVSTNGKSPTLGKTIRDRIGELLESGYPELLEFLGGIRWEVHSRHAEYEERKRDFELIVQNSLKKLYDKEFPFFPQTVKTDHPGKVYLVGAGPGDPDLITVKGLRLLHRADVVLYDALINLDLLDHLSLTAERIFAGKRGGCHSASQEEINRILIDRANQGNVVVRLKGGDPFVFGRGGEELEALRDVGIEVEVVPGITSGTGVPASIGLPLTYRHVSSSVVFVTGHECGDKERSVDWNSIAGIDTIVVYMGIRSIGTIATSLRNAGKSPDTPAAVVFSGTWPEESIIEGTLGSIAERISDRESGRPGIILIGEVVRLLHRQGDGRTVKETQAVEDVW
ncbi:MAG: uroporphyrinogen-III C-methyltransferase [Ignavibacteriales bacterium]|nr:uroporphyrinogen-III C-methyltransferase [Ignavibacteriales bacterium]